MEMKEHGIAERRVSRILDHFPGADEVPPTLNPHIIPMSCSGTVNSMVRRCDNRLLFARQSSHSQACFMRQVQFTQDSAPGNSSQKKLPVNCCGLGDTYKHSGEPMFSRQSPANPTMSALRDDQHVKEGFTPSSTEAPMFARENSGESEIKQLLFHRAGRAAIISGVEWSPRIDVVESNSSYTVTVELPGASICDIRVEVDNQNLTVTGTRSTRQWKVANDSDTLNTTYHRREILHGPYRVVWPLPNDANKDSVSAEFMDGFLQIIFPKL